MDDDTLVCRMLDVGRQRDKRKKWIQCFSGTSSVSVTFYIEQNVGTTMHRIHELAILCLALIKAR